MMEDIIKDRLIETLQRAVDAENMMYFCCGHLAALIKNGKIRNEFNSLSKAAKENEEFLIGCLKDLNISSYLPKVQCRYCNISTESFSLLGAINLGLEVIDVAVKLYRELLKLTDNPIHKKIFKEILNKKNSQKIFLKKEKRFASLDEFKLSYMDSNCIPEIISKL